MKERFKFIKGTNKQYSIGSKGSVRNNKTGNILKGRIINGRRAIEIKNLFFNKPIHILVAEHFLSNKNNHKYVEFIDGNYLNPDYKNLRWVSHRVFSSKIINKRRKMFKEKYMGKNHWRSRPFKIGNKRFNTLAEACLYMKYRHAGGMDVIKKRLVNENFKEYQYI